MKKLHFTQYINASVEKVWDVMLGKETYPKWTSVFNPEDFGNSYFKGDWSVDSKMLFIGTNKEGNESGMVSRIAENRLHDFVSIEHVGMMQNGVEDTTSEEVKNGPLRLRIIHLLKKKDEQNLS